MKHVVRTLSAATAIIAALVMASPRSAHSAGGYPERPVKVIVPFAPAGPTDVVARMIAQKLSERLGKQFYIENVAGAGGNLGMAQVARATPDGYTVLFASSSIVVNPSLYPRIPFDVYRDFSPVTVAGAGPNVLVVHPSLPAKTVSELVALVKANPGKYAFASPGVGTTPHLSGELFKQTLALDLVHVPFGGAGPAIQSAVGGHTPIAFTALAPAVPIIKEGKLRALAVSAKKRVGILPDVPTFEEAGLRGQEADTLQGVLVPAGTPKEIVDLLYREIKAIVALPDIKQRFEQLGLEAIANTPDQFAIQIREEVERWAQVIKKANIKTE